MNNTFETPYTIPDPDTDTVQYSQGPTGGNEGRILINEGGTYEAMATTTSGTLCSKAISIQLLTSEIAKITQKDLNVIDLEGDTGSVEINKNNLEFS